MQKVYCRGVRSSGLPAAAFFKNFSTELIAGEGAFLLQ